MKFGLGAGLVLLILVSSCTTFRLDPRAGDGVSVRQDRGKPTAVLDGQVLAVEAQGTWGPEVKFALKVTNKTTKTLHLDGDQFRLFAGEGDRWTPVRVVPSNEVYDQASRYLVAGTALMAVGAIVFSRPSTVRTQDTTEATVVHGGGASVVLVQTQRRTYYDEGTLGTNLDAVGHAARQGAEGLADLKDNLFYSVDLEAGKSYNGWVFGETAKGTLYKLVLPVDGQEYAVVFEKVKTRL